MAQDPVLVDFQCHRVEMRVDRSVPQTQVVSCNGGREGLFISRACQRVCPGIRIIGNDAFEGRADRNLGFDIHGGGIQRIDPITGKLTEKFKKAHDALKEWANVTFDKLTARIQKLRKAVEGGFLDKSVLEEELKRVMPQLKLQVISELEPFKNQFNSQREYEGSVASEFVATVSELFGDVGNEILRKIYQGMSGAEIGRAILRDNERSLSGGNGTTAYINGIEQVMTKSVNSLADSIAALIFEIDQQKGKLTSHQYEVNGHTFEFSIAETVNLFSKEFSQSMGEFGERAKGVADTFSSNLAPVNSSIQLLNTSINNNSAAVRSAGDSMLSLINSIQTPNSNTSTVSFIDYSAQFANVIKELVNINSATHDNTVAVRSVENAVNNLQSAVAALQSGNTFNIDVQQNGFSIQSKSTADALARNTVSAIRSGLGNGVM